MKYQDSRYLQFYVIDGDEGIEIIEKSAAGDCLAMASEALENGGRVKVYVEDLDEDDQKEVIELLLRAGKMHQPVLLDEDDSSDLEYSLTDPESGDCIIQSIEYVEGWFASLFIGPFATDAAANSIVDKFVVESNQSDFDEFLATLEEDDEENAGDEDEDEADDDDGFDDGFDDDTDDDVDSDDDDAPDEGEDAKDGDVS